VFKIQQLVPSKERQQSENSFTRCFGANTISSLLSNWFNLSIFELINTLTSDKQVSRRLDIFSSYQVVCVGRAPVHCFAGKPIMLLKRPCAALTWMKSYLNDRTQRVAVHSQK
jgi:hypothetical protein